MYLKCMVPKPKSLLIKMQYQKLQASISKRDVKIKMIKFYQKKRSQMKSFYLNVIKFMWEVIYVHFYNWDRSLYLVLVVYDLVELIIKGSH